MTAFLSTIQERVEYIYGLFHQLEQLEFKDAKQASKKVSPPPSTVLTHYSIEEIKSRYKRVAKIILRIPPALIEIHKRCELTMPLLVFITEAIQRLKEPTLKFIERL